MSDRRLQLITGAAFFAVMGAIGYFTIARGRTYALEKGVHIPVLLESAEGLRVGARVFVLGIEMGVVSSVHYVLTREDNSIIPWDEEGKPRRADRPAGQRVICILDLERDVQLYPNYSLKSRYPSPISQKIVSLNPGRLLAPPGGKAGTGGTTDPAWRPLRMTQPQLRAFLQSGVLPADGTMLASQNSDDPIYLAASIIADNRQTLLRITSNLAEITHKVNVGQGTLSAVLNQETLSRETNNSLAGLVIFLNEIRHGVEDTRESRAMTDFIAALLPVMFKVAGL